MEKDITLDLAQRLRRLLEADRVQVVLTRTADEYVSIADRWNRVRAGGARLFVSLHVNAYQGDPTISGFTVFYPKPSSQLLAESIEAGLSRTLRPFESADAGAQVKPDLWIRADIPTVTVEPAYLTNPKEAALLAKDVFRDAVVRGIHEGVLAFEPEIEARRDAIQRLEREAAERQRPAADPAAAAAGLHVTWQLAGSAGAAILLILLIGFAVSRRPSPSRRAARRRRRRGSAAASPMVGRDIETVGRHRRA